jgi:N utilization substance protein A
MMDIKSLGTAIDQIAAEKGIPSDRVLEAVESAIAAAYKREYRKKTEVIRSKFDLSTGNIKFWQIKTVVDPEEVRIVADEEEVEEQKETKEDETALPRYNEDRHIFLADAKKIKKDAVIGEELEFPLEMHADFGRIAAQTAKQVILQSIREAERKSIQQEFSGKEGEIVSGIIQRFERGNVYVDLGRAIGIMFPNESIPSEHYRVGQRMRFFVLAVQDDPRRPGIILSRAHPRFVVKLFELEIPEMAESIVEIKGIARESGSRTKIAVASNQEGVDPVGSAVGQRGMRVMAVTNELGNEKIDIVEWSEDVEKFISHSLSPAKVKLVELLPRREARVLVAEDQLSLAIGKGGQNVRLAARLTGWKIDVRSQSNPDEVQEGGVADAPKEQESAEEKQ